MKNINSQVLRKTFAFSLARFVLARFTLAHFVLVAILVPALLIGSAFTFGGSKLQAQANGSSKQGFFAGFVYLNGFKVDTTTLVTTNSTTITDSTTGYRIDVDRGNSGYGATNSRIEASVDNYFYNNQISGSFHYNGIGTLFKESCETGVTSVTADGITYEYSSFYLESFDAGTSKGQGTIVTTTGDGPTIDNRFPTGVGNNGRDTNYCFTYFFGDLSSDRMKIKEYQIATPDSDPTPTSVPADPTAIPSSKSDQLSGIGLQFGFRWEKWRASLTHFTGKGGANELANTLVMADYFVNKGLFVGGGLASMKLTNSANGSTSASATSPVLQVGYKQKLTPNLSLNFGLTKYISGVSLKNSVTTNNTTTANANTTPMVLRSFQETQTASGDSAVFGIRGISTAGIYIHARYFVNDSGVFINDYRTPVTQVRSRTVYINKILTPAEESKTQTTTTTETDAELKAPLVISLSLHLSF